MTKPNILITGVTGFVGGHLLQALRGQEYARLWGLSRHQPEHDSLYDGVSLIQGDLCDQPHMKSLLGKVKPDWIFHLAGQAVVAKSWAAPRDTFISNVDAQISMFESLRSLKLNPKILVVGSSEEYGLIKKDELPVQETNPLRPLSPYAVSKVAQDLLAFQYFQSYGLRAVRVRAFNHTGPGRPNQYAISNFAYQISRIELGMAPSELLVGNLDVQRDYMDVRDTVSAYIQVMERGEAGEVYNICSGRSQNLHDILQTLMSFSQKAIQVKVDPSRFRPSDLPVIYGTSSKLQRLTGWEPKIPMQKTLQDLLNYWRDRNSSPSSNVAHSSEE